MDRWFDRQFDFSFGADKYDTVYKRLQQAPVTLKHLVGKLPEDILTLRPDHKWSVKEHTGHLSVLEPIWQTRFRDILEKKSTLTIADLDNRATTEAGFNDNALPALLDRFSGERKTTLTLLDNINGLDQGQTSLHPRLRKPMRMIDLAYFVAEHDDHHIAFIRKIISGR